MLYGMACSDLEFLITGHAPKVFYCLETGYMDAVMILIVFSVLLRMHTHLNKYIFNYSVLAQVPVSPMQCLT